MRAGDRSVSTVLPGDERAVGGPRLREMHALAGVLIVWVGQAVSAYLWLQANQFAIGWDRPKHLVSTLIFNGILRPVNVQTVFQVFSLNLGYYPPLYPLSAVPLYRLFGVSDDVAALANVFYMLILLLSVYGIGRRLYSPAVGLLAAFLAATSPFLFSMAHYTYIDYALTSLIALAVYLLLLTEGFRRTLPLLAFGLALGLGMLTKWTPVVFVVGPLLLVIVHARLFQADRDGLRRWRLPWWESLAGLAAGLALTWLWYAPNADLAATLVLGNWLPTLSVVLFGGTVFLILLPRNPALNLLKSLAIAGLLTSSWYLPRADMFRDIYTIVVGGRADRPNFSSLSAYLYYPDRLINEGLGWPLFVLYAALVLFSLRRLLISGRRLSWQDGYLLVWFLAPLAVATLSTHREARSVLPLMLPLCVGLARLLVQMKPAGPRRAVLLAVVLFSTAQFVVLHVGALEPMARATETQAPGVGRLGLFAAGDHLAWADRGEQDNRYWIVPDVLRTIAGDGGSTVRLGLLINSRQVNEYNIDYQVRTQFPNVAVVDLTRNRDLTPGFPRLFGCNYLLLRDAPDSSEPAGLVRTILDETPDTFAGSFETLKTYSWPDGETVYLFRNRNGRIPDHFGADRLTPAQHAVEVDFGRDLRLLGYSLDGSRAESEGNVYLTLYWMALREMREDYSMQLKLLNGVRHVWGEQEGRPRWDAGLTSKWFPGEVVEDIRALPIWPGTPPGSYQIEVLIQGLREGGMLEPVGGELLLGPVRVPARSWSVSSLDLDRTSEAVFGGRVRLLGSRIESGLQPGDGVHLTLFWQAVQEVGDDYVVFNHLVDSPGKVWGQKDSPPADGFYPTSQWTAGQIVRDRYDLLIPSDAPPGDYVIRTGLYLPEGGRRLPLSAPEGQAGGDYVELARLTVGARK